MVSDVIRKWRLVVDEASTDALIATGRSARRKLHDKLEQLAAAMHEAELDASLEETRTP